eukprot:5676174-Prymnesium_polylepis.1
MAGAGDHQWCALALNTPPLAPPLITPNPACRAFLRRNGAILPFVNTVRAGENVCCSPCSFDERRAARRRQRFQRDL